jgi:hypothetical protein
MFQGGSVQSMGGMDELNLGFGGIYGKRLAIGFSFGIPMLNYREVREYSEIDERDTLYAIKSFDLMEKGVVSGRGFNAKFGAVLISADWLRVGGALHIPTFLKIADSREYSLVSKWDDGRTREAGVSPSTLSYQLTTPFRANLGAGFIFGKSGLVGIEWGYVDYSQASVRGSENSFDVNQGIAKNLGQVQSWKAGAELKLSKRYCVRGGINHLDAKSTEKIGYSFGFGIIESGEDADIHYAIDFGCRYGSYAGSFMPYGMGASGEPVVTSAFARHAFFLTGTVKF